MASDPVHAVEGLAARVRELRGKATRLSTLRDQLDAELQAKGQEVGELTTLIEKLTKVGELFRLLMDLLVVKQVRSVENVVTEGLRTIFHDLELAFEADVGPKYGKVSVEFFIRQGAKDDPLSHRGRPLEAFGGGPSSVASLALRVLTVMKLKRYPFLALDESLGAVSDEYTDTTGQFLRRLAEQLGLDVLLVTHKAAYVDHADKAYTCSEVVEKDGRRHLALGGIR